MYDLLMNDFIQKTLGTLAVLSLFFLLNWHTERQVCKTTPPRNTQNIPDLQNNSASNK